MLKAVKLILFFLLAVSFLKKFRAKNSQPSPAEEQHRTPKDKSANMDLHQSIPADYETHDKEWQSQQRENWHRQLWPQWVLAGTALLAGVVGVITLVILNRTVELTKQQLYVSQRAWVGLNGPIIINSPFTYDADGAVLDIKLVLKNSGNSVATAVVPLVNAVFAEVDEIKRLRDIQVSLCNPIPGIDIIGYILLPGQEITTAILRQKIPYSKMKAADRMWMVGCIRYVDQFAVTHKTFFQHMFQPPFKVGVTTGIFHPYVMGNSAD